MREGDAPVACKLIEEMNLKHYTLAYDDENNIIKPPTHEVMNLVPSRHKNLFAPDVDPSPILHEGAVLEALTDVN